jgi:uncharacterized membrane protein (UPF0127 family)
MIIKNKNKNITVVDPAIYADSLFQGIFGLIFYKKPIGMIFRTHFGIHTFFMRYAIDVLILNRRNKVIAINAGLRPNRIYFWNPRYSIVVELPKGSVERSKTEVGDFLELV